MCLAKVYVHAAAAVGAPAGAISGDDGTPTLVMENVTRLTVNGDRIGLTSLLGASQEITGRVVSMDFMEGRLLLESTAPAV